jgi:hypothetical protein
MPKQSENSDENIHLLNQVHVSTGSVLGLIVRDSDSAANFKPGTFFD